MTTASQHPSTVQKPVSVPTAGTVSVVDILVALLLLVGFFIGPLKMIGAGWLGYALPDVLAVLILLVVFAERAFRRLPLFGSSPLTIPIVLIGVICILQLANPEAPFIRTVMGLRTWLLYLGFYFVGLYGLRSTCQVERLYTLLLILGCLTATYGLYQWRAGPQAFATWSDPYGHYARVMWSAGQFRAFSTFTLPNLFGINMGFLMLVAFGVAASPRLKARWRIAAAGAFVLMGAALAASGTRAPMVLLLFAGIVGLSVLPSVPRRMRLAVTAGALSIAAVILILAVIGPAIGTRFISVLQPDQFFWKWFHPLMFGLRIAAAHPFGFGPGFAGGVPQFINDPAIRGIPWTDIDSGYGSAAAELGFVGFALFVYIAAKVAIAGVRAWGRLRPGRLRDLMLAPALLCILYPVLGLVGGNHATIPDSIYYWLLIGVLMKTPALERDSGEVAVSISQALPETA